MASVCVTRFEVLKKNNFVKKKEIEERTYFFHCCPFIVSTSMEYSWVKTKFTTRIINSLLSAKNFPNYDSAFSIKTFMRPLKIIKPRTDCLFAVHFELHSFLYLTVYHSIDLILAWCRYLLPKNFTLAVAKLHNQFRKLVEMWEYHVLRIFDRNCIKYPWLYMRCGCVCQI